MNATIILDDIQPQLDYLNDLALRRSRLIEELLSACTTPKDRHELNLIGGFLCRFNESIRIINKSESPDLLIEMAGHRVAIELNELLIQKEAKRIRSIRAILDGAQLLFIESHPNLNYFVTIFVNKDHLKASKRDQREISQAIAQYVYNQIIGKEEPPPYPFIRGCHLQLYNQPTQFLMNETPAEINWLTHEIITKEICLKEQKLAFYKSNAPGYEQWLLLTVYDGCADSYTVDLRILNLPLITSFDRIYLYSQRTGQIWWISSSTKSTSLH